MEAVDTKKIATVKGLITKAKNTARDVSVNSQEDYNRVGSIYIDIKKKAREFEKEKKSWLDPINQLRNKVFSYTRPVEAEFKALLNAISDQMTAWESKVEAERQQDAIRLEAAADSGEMSLEDATDKAGKLTTVDPVQSSKGKLGAQVRHELVVTDSSKLKREFLMPDMAKIKDHYQSTGRIPAGVELQKNVVRTARLA